LFIDHIGQLAIGAQARLGSLLRAQSCPIGGVTTLDDDRRVRIVAGSSRSLYADLAAGAFDDTLFYRLNVIHIDLIHHREPEERS
jgi:DNA-binding NtrC family response regulator